MNVNIATLSEAGWVSGLAEKCDLLISYYFLSENSQSNLYAGRIVSLPYQIQQFGDDELRLKQAMTETLTAYFGRYFDRADITVTTDKPLPSDPSRIHVQVDIIVFEGNTSYSAGREIRTINGKIENIFIINNEIGGS